MKDGTEKALNWWNELSITEKIEHSKLYRGDEAWYLFTVNDIEMMYFEESAEGKEEFDKAFNLVLSKNILAREIKDLYQRLGERVSESTIFHLEEIEKELGTANQPGVRNIITSPHNI